MTTGVVVCEGRRVDFEYAAPSYRGNEAATGLWNADRGTDGPGLGETQADDRERAGARRGLDRTPGHDGCGRARDRGAGY
jgi:hypothetical protein